MEYSYLTLRLPLYLVEGIERLAEYDKLNSTYYSNELKGYLSAKLYERLQEVEKELKAIEEKKRTERLNELNKAYLEGRINPY